MLPHRKKRLQNILLLLGSSFIGIFLILTALNSQLDLFYSPSELNKNNLPQERIKLGGMVKKGSIKYEDTKVLFVLTDFEEDLDIEFDGIPPDLFKEDSGAVMLGSFDGNGVFVAEEVFAKHDENYMPPEVAEALAEKGHPMGIEAKGD